MTRRCAVGVVIPAVLVAVAGTAHAQLAYDVSEDGRTFVEVVPHEPVGHVIVSRTGRALPFNTTPDIEIMLRRQIGGLQVADMNGDGFNDIVAVCYISNSFPPYDDWHDFILYGTDGSVEPTPSWISANETHSADVQIGDINTDTFPDLVVIHGGSVRADTVEIYFGAAGGPATSSGFVSNIPGRVWGTASVLTDIDNDTDLDLVVTGQGLSPDPFRPMFMLRGNGVGLSQAPAWQSDDAEITGGIDAADITGDNLPELAVSKWSNFESGIIANNAGTPAGAPYVTVGNTDAHRGAAFGNVDNDPELEVVIGADPTTAYDIKEGSLEPIWSGIPPFVSAPQDLRLHDADGDGDLDVAEVIFSDGRAHIYQNNNGVLDTSPTWTYDASQSGTAIAFGDLNEDGRDDLVVGYSGEPCIRVFFAVSPMCNGADLALPFGTLNFADVQAFLGAFGSSDPAADLAAPMGTFNFADVQAFLGAFGQGC